MNKGWSMDKIRNFRAIKDIFRVRYSMFGNNIKVFQETSSPKGTRILVLQKSLYFKTPVTIEERPFTPLKFAANSNPTLKAPEIFAPDFNAMERLLTRRSNYINY
jgi:hypothetical protein